jgi:hypothetical protein
MKWNDTGILFHSSGRTSLKCGGADEQALNIEQPVMKRLMITTKIFNIHFCDFCFLFSRNFFLAFLQFKESP